MNSAINQNTAIVIFGDSPIDLYERKHLSKKEFLNYNIVDAFEHHSISIAKETGLPYFWYQNDQQSGSSYGERLYNAIHEVFEKGFERIIAIGTDCPFLSSQILLQFNEHLNTNEVVIGPDQRGGIYALGIQKSSFYQLNFIQLNWQSNQFLNSLQTELYLKNISFQGMLSLSDIHSLKDCQKFLLIQSNNWFIQLLKQLFRVQFQPKQCCSIQQLNQAALASGLRAPPTF